MNSRIHRFSVGQRLALAVSTALLLSLIALPTFAVESRTFTDSFDTSASSMLRLHNLAGSLKVVAGSGNQVQVKATVYAQAGNSSETQKLLDGMKWVESEDRKGRPIMALAYPVSKYKTFHYPGSGQNSQKSSFLERLFSSFGHSNTTSTYLGKRVGVSSSRSGSSPTLYVDLVVSMPAQASLGLRNVAGGISGGSLSGALDLDTGSGAVSVEAMDGDLRIDTGSGKVQVGQARGETWIDTGSGTIRVRELIGNGNLDTGSGAIVVEQVAAGKLRLDTGSGSIKVNGGQAGDLVADTGSGSINILDVEIETFVGDTGSGSVTLRSSLADARDISIDTGSGGVSIYGGPDASFDLDARQGSGRLKVGYSDAELRKRGSKVVGASRAGGRTQIVIDTGSGSCVIAPAEQ